MGDEKSAGRNFLISYFKEKGRKIRGDQTSSFWSIQGEGRKIRVGEKSGAEKSGGTKNPGDENAVNRATVGQS
jgi:hypothetical protein